MSSSGVLLGRRPHAVPRRHECSTAFSALHEAPAGLLVPLDSDGWEI
jgi:hypothetical protein